MLPWFSSWFWETSMSWKTVAGKTSGVNPLSLSGSVFTDLKDRFSPDEPPFTDDCSKNGTLFATVGIEFFTHLYGQYGQRDEFFEIWQKHHAQTGGGGSRSSARMGFWDSLAVRWKIYEWNHLAHRLQLEPSLGLFGRAIQRPSLKGKPLPWDLIRPCPNSPVCLAQFASFSHVPAPNQKNIYNINHFQGTSTHPSYCYNNTNATDLISKSTHTVLVVLQINNKDVVLGILWNFELFLCTWFLQLNHSHGLTQASPCM